MVRLIHFFALLLMVNAQLFAASRGAEAPNPHNDWLPIEMSQPTKDILAIGWQGIFDYHKNPNTSHAMDMHIFCNNIVFANPQHKSLAYLNVTSYLHGFYNYHAHLKHAYATHANQHATTVVLEPLEVSRKRIEFFGQYCALEEKSSKRPESWHVLRKHTEHYCRLIDDLPNLPQQLKQADAYLKDDMQQVTKGT